MNNLNKAFFILLILLVGSFNVFCEDFGLTPEICAEDVIKKYKENKFYLDSNYFEIKYKFDEENLIFIEQDSTDTKISLNSDFYYHDINTKGESNILMEKLISVFDEREKERLRDGTSKIKAYCIKDKKNNKFLFCSLLSISATYCWFVIMPNKKIYFVPSLSGNIQLFYISSNEYNNPKIVFTEISKSGLDIFSLPYAYISHYLEFYAITNGNIVKKNSVLWIWDKYILEPYGTAPAFPR